MTPELVAAARVRQVVADLDGTCNSVDEVASVEEAADPAFLEALREHLFWCHGCGFWCPQNCRSEQPRLCLMCDQIKNGEFE